MARKCLTNHIKRYDISNFSEITPLGSGGYGEIISAYSIFDKKYVALKKFSKNTNHEMDSFFLEIGYLTHLNNFSNGNYVVKIYGYCIADNILYIVLEKLDNSIYRRYTGAKFTQIYPSMYNNIIYELLSILNFIHSHGIVHNDFKLENIMFEKIKESESESEDEDEHDRFKLKAIDFGASTFLGISPFIPNVTFFSHSGYTAPPDGRDNCSKYNILGYVENNRPSYQSDIFSLGQCIIALILHRADYKGIIIDDKLYHYHIYGSGNHTLYSIKSGNTILSPDYINDRLGPGGYNILLKMLNNTSSLRPSAKELLNDTYFTFPKQRGYLEVQSGGLYTNHYIYSKQEIMNNSYELKYKDDIHMNFINNEYCIYKDTDITHYNDLIYVAQFFPFRFKGHHFSSGFEYDVMINVLYNYINMYKNILEGFDAGNPPPAESVFINIIVEIYGIIYMYPYYPDTIYKQLMFTDHVISALNTKCIINPFITQIHYVLLDLQKNDIYPIDIINEIEDFILTGIYTFTIIPYSEVFLPTTVWKLIIFFTLKAISIILKVDTLNIISSPPLDYLEIDRELYTTLDAILNKKLTIYNDQLSKRYDSIDKDLLFKNKE